MKKSIFLFFAAILCAIGVQAADAITSDGTARLYFHMTNGVSWWNAGTDGNGNFAYFYGSSGNKWSAHAVKHSGSIYYIVIPAGTWDHVILTRNNTSTSPSWDNKWNQTGNIPLSKSGNYLSKFKEGNGDAAASTYTWSTQKPESTASVTANPTTVFVGAQSTLSSALTSNADINTNKSTSYSVSPATGSVASGKFTATAAGEYTVTATVTYHPNGYASITSTATATTTIIVQEPTEEVHDVAVSYMFESTEIATSETVASVGVETSVKVTAPEIAKYTFSNWTLGADVTTEDALTNTAINITTKAGGSDFTLTANYEKAKLTYTVTVPAGTENCYMAGEMNGWDVENPIEMTKQGENVFTTTLEGVATTDEYKYLSKKGSWDYADVQESNRTWTANDVVTAWKDPLATNVHLVGNMFANWDKTPDKEFRKATKDATTASIVVALDANKDYELKVRRGDDWTSCTSKITNTVSNLQFSTSNNDNCKMKTTVAGDYTFTWTISSSKLAVTYPTICAITATANDDAMGTVAGAGNYGKGSTATLTATPNDGYLFVNWTKGGEVVATTQEYSFKVTEAVALVANFEAAPEEVHNVTVSYVCGGNKIAEDQTVAAVGETSAKTVEAPAIFGYTFASWKLGAGVTSADATANPISINIVAGASDYTLTANYTEIPKVKIYVVNNKKWSKVNVYGWKDGEAQGTPAWPGQEITANLETEKVAGFDVYSYSVVPGSYDNLILNNGSDKTEDYKWTDGKYYYVGAAKNYAGGTAEEVATALGATTSYDYYIYGNMNGWKEDANYGMTDEDEDGIYEKTLTFKNNAEFKVKGTDWYGSESVEGTYKEVSDNGGNIKLSLSADTEVTVKFNSGTKKITFEGLTEIVPKYYLVGTFNEWNPADPNYEMTLDGGLYKKEVTFAKDVQFKVCNGSWSASWGKDNLGGIQYNELTEQDGNIKMKEAKTFTVIFNPAEHLILFEGLTEKVTYVLMGVNGDWDNGIELTPNPKKAGEYMLLAQTIAKATDAVKIVKIEGGNKTQYCQFENVKDGSVTCTEGPHKNIVLEDGIYNFYYTTNDNKVYIETSTPAHTRTVPAGYYATVCLPNNIINVVGATLFEVAGKEGNKVIFDEVLTPVAGLPYIFLAEENTISFYCGIETAATPGNHKSLHGTFEDMVDADLDGMYMVQNNKIVKCAATGCNIPKNRAYFDGTELESLGSAPAPMPGRRRITMGAESENTATGVEGIIVPEGQTIKVISNGQLIIIRNGEKFNAQGVRL